VYTRRSDGTTGTYYATSDHLGSADLVMDSAANVLVRESFTPFGARRGGNWQSIPSAADYTSIQSTTRQGFTGHEMLDSVSLIHMNGRVYDPTLGRFLSADSVIQSLGNTQSINPYSYAWNDPLRYIDPSGHSLLGAIIGIVAAIIVIYFTGGTGAYLYSAYFDVALPNTVLAGFVGGFVGALVSTGSLSAALTAGAIGAVTAGLFSYVGGQAADGGWGIGARTLAHAAVGCVSGQLSSGNCGKGALSAAVSEYLGSQVLHGDEAARWGSGEMFAQTVKYALIGGFAARATGEDFVEGFSIGAAGYLFNEAAHPARPAALYTSTDGFATEDDAAKAAYAMAATYKDSRTVEYGGVIFQDSAGYQFTVFRGDTSSVQFTLHGGIVDWWHTHPADPFCGECNSGNENLSSGDIGQEKWIQSNTHYAVGAYLLTPTNILKFIPFPLDRSNGYGYTLPYP
jgi:RHS repeat-associated protein